MYEKGCMLYHKQAGDTVFFDRDLGDDEFLVSPAVVYVCGDGVDEPHYEEVCPAITKLVVHSSDYSDQPPKKPIPKYLDEDIQAAKKRVESLSERYHQLSKQMADERDEHSKHMKALKERVGKLTPRHQRLMELALAHFEGVDLFVVLCNNSSYSLKHLSDFEDNYGFRMLGLYGDHGENKLSYDWVLNSYSDDSGSKAQCLVAATREDILVRCIEFKNKMQSGDWRRAVFIEWLMQEFGYEPSPSEVKVLQDADLKRREEERNRKAREVETLKQTALKLGFELQPKQ